MAKLLKKNKFVNPIYDFFGMIIFSIANNYMPVTKSILVSTCILAAIFLISAFVRREILLWNFYRAAGVAVIYATFLLLDGKLPDIFNPVFPEIIIFCYLILLLFLNPFMKKSIKARTDVGPGFYEEYYRLVKYFTIIFFLYLLSYFLFRTNETVQTTARHVLTGMLILSIIYEYIRVTIVKINLSKEEWYPIITEKGDVLGKIEKSESLLGEEKLLHPVVRIHIIKDGFIYLHKYWSDDLIFGGLWDTAISRHILFRESLEEAIARAAKTMYGIEKLKPIFLTRYTKETANEKQLAVVYYTEEIKNVKIRDRNIETGKFWPIQQVIKELDSGIFTESFVQEFKVLCKKVIYCDDLSD